MSKSKSSGSWLFLLLIVIALVGISALRMFKIIGPSGETTIVWVEDYSRGLEMAGQQNKLVLLYFSGDWCPPCNTMKKLVWPEDRVEGLVEEYFIPVLVDMPQNQPASPQAKLADQFDVDSIPTMIVLESDGLEIERSGPLLAARDMVGFLAKYKKDAGEPNPQP